MARIATILVGILTLCGTAMAQSNSGSMETGASAQGDVKSNGSGGASGQAAAQSSLAAGTAVNAELNESLDSKKVKSGDSVTAHTTEALKADGRLVLPKGTKLVGHITRASARVKGDADSALAVRFDRAILKNGQEMPLNLTIQALAAAQGVAAVGGDDLEGAGNVGAGAASGGRGTLGGVGTTVGGAASGAASTVPRTAQGATGAVNSTVGATAGAAAGTTGGVTGGLNSAGQLSSTSRGVFGLNGLNLDASATNSTQGSLITSTGKNVHLETGTKMLLVTQADVSASAQR